MWYSTQLWTPNSNLNSQHGQALLALLILLVLAGSAAFYVYFSPTSAAIEKDKITAAALAQAKAALIGYAVGVNFAGGDERPGDFPCPDINDSGLTGSSCGNAAGTTGQTLRIGRLPWKSLGLPDLRDGDGERLWYALSSNFKYNTRTTCTTPDDPGCLNSDSRGTITVRNNAGTIMHDGMNPDPYSPSGVIAVIFAPGSVLRRQDSPTPQDRSCSGGTCTAAGVCTSSPVTATAKCNPTNYLDVIGPPVLTVTGATASTEDNAGFIDGSNTDGFINGVIRDASGNVIVNDKLITITYDDLMPLLERRVAKEAYNCVTAYGAASSGRYPWAASVSASAAGDYSSLQNERFGRLPDSFSQTLLGVIPPSNLFLSLIVNTVCSITPGLCMRTSWPDASATPACYITTGTWWRNWKNQVFYGVADAYKPATSVVGFSVSVPPPTGCDGIAGNYDCLAVSPPTAINVDNKRFVVVVAGKTLSIPSDPPFVTAPLNQARSTLSQRQNSANYLERENGNNTGTSNIYGQQPPAAAFNDTLLFPQ